MTLVSLTVEVEQINGPTPTPAKLAAAVAKHVAQSGDFTFTTGGRAFASTRWRIVGATRGEIEDASSIEADPMAAQRRGL